MSESIEQDIIDDTTDHENIPTYDEDDEDDDTLYPDEDLTDTAV